MIEMLLHILNWTVAKLIELWAFTWVTVGFWKFVLLAGKLILPVAAIILAWKWWERRWAQKMSEELIKRRSAC